MKNQKVAPKFSIRVAFSRSRHKTSYIRIRLIETTLHRVPLQPGFICSLLKEHYLAIQTDNGVL